MFYNYAFVYFSLFKKTNREIRETNRKIDKNMNIMYKAAEHSEKLIFTYDNDLKEIIVKTRKLNPLFGEKIIISGPKKLIFYVVIVPESIEDLKKII